MCMQGITQLDELLQICSFGGDTAWCIKRYVECWAAKVTMQNMTKECRLCRMYLNANLI